MDIEQASTLGIKDRGKWLPFMFDMDIVKAVKMSSDETEDTVYGCSTIYTDDGDTYIIDTPYSRFFQIYKEYHHLINIIVNEDDLLKKKDDNLDF